MSEFGANLKDAAIRKQLAARGLLGDLTATGADAGDFRRRMPAKEVTFEEMAGAVELYDGLVATEPGFDQYDGQREGGWIAARGSSAENRSERRISLRRRTTEYSLDQLEEMDIVEARLHMKDIVAFHPLPTIPDIRGLHMAANKLLEEDRKRDIPISGEGEQVNTADVLDRIDRLESRLAENVNAIRWDIRLLLERYPDHPGLREASEDFLDEIE